MPGPAARGAVGLQDRPPLGGTGVRAAAGRVGSGDRWANVPPCPSAGDPPSCPMGSGSSRGQGDPLGGAADVAAPPPPFQPLIQLFRASLQPPAPQARLCRPADGHPWENARVSLTGAGAVTAAAAELPGWKTAAGFTHLVGAQPEQSQWHTQNQTAGRKPGADGDKERFILESESPGTLGWNRSPAREVPAISEQERACR